LGCRYVGALPVATPGSVNAYSMSPKNSLGTASYGSANVAVYLSKSDAGKVAAEKAAEVIAQAIQQVGVARIIVATGNSQLEVSAELVKTKLVDWSRVEIFHMDEYVGIPQDHPSSFRYWIRQRVEEIVHPRKVNYLDGDAPNLAAEIERYSNLLTAAPIHLAFVGFGENGHIAFNDPPVADFADPAIVKRVTLDTACRHQQAGEGHFANFDAVPKEAVTVTCPGLFRAENWICCVSDSRKAEAVRNALEGPISTACPASLARNHPNTWVYLDTASAGLLNEFAELKVS
jgi:glucosamine-6-phosphate deaminase